MLKFQTIQLSKITYKKNKKTYTHHRETNLIHSSLRSESKNIFYHEITPNTYIKIMNRHIRKFSKLIW